MPEELYHAHYEMWASRLDTAEEILDSLMGRRDVWSAFSIAECALWRLFFHETEDTKEAVEESLRTLGEILSETEKQNSLSEGWWLTSAVTFTPKKKKQATAEEANRFSKYLDALVGYGYYYIISSFMMIKDYQLVTGGNFR